MDVPVYFVPQCHALYNVIYGIMQVHLTLRQPDPLTRTDASHEVGVAVGVGGQLLLLGPLLGRLGGGGGRIGAHAPPRDSPTLRRPTDHRLPGLFAKESGTMPSSSWCSSGMLRRLIEFRVECRLARVQHECQTVNSPQIHSNKTS